MVIVLFILGMTVAYQANKPCDNACFQRKLNEDNKVVREVNPNDNSWRYSPRRSIDNNGQFIQR